MQLLGFILTCLMSLVVFTFIFDHETSLITFLPINQKEADTKHELAFESHQPIPTAINKKNLLWVYMDDMRPDIHHPYSRPNARTPFLDSFSKLPQTLVFSHCENLFRVQERIDDVFSLLQS